jgi:hypothetical protein
MIRAHREFPRFNDRHIITGIVHTVDAVHAVVDARWRRVRFCSYILRLYVTEL